MSSICSTHGVTDDKQFDVKAVRAVIKGKIRSDKAHKIDHSIIGVVPGDEGEYGALIPYPSGMLFVVTDYVTVFYVKYTDVCFLLNDFFYCSI